MVFSRIKVFLLVVLFLGCKVDSLEEAVVKGSLSIDKKASQAVIKKLNFRRDRSNFSDKQFKNKHVVVFYIDGLVRTVMEDMAKHGDRLVRYKKDGKRFYYTKKIIKNSKMLWSNLDDQKIAALAKLKQGQGSSVKALIRDQKFSSSYDSIKKQLRAVKSSEIEDYYIRRHYLKLNVINNTFMKKGLRYSRAFTIFPSLTIPANGSMFTGLDTDRHTIKSQGEMDRHLLEQWVKKKKSQKPSLHSISSVRHEQEYPLANYRKVVEGAGVPMLYDIVRHVMKPSDINESNMYFPNDFYASTLPIHFKAVEGSFTTGYANSSFLKSSPDIDSSNWQALRDESNERFGTKNREDRLPKLLIMWMPNTDQLSHGENEASLKSKLIPDALGSGQYGASLRLELKKADLIIGSVMQLYNKNGWSDQTDYVLTADHGHLGGVSYQQLANHNQSKGAADGDIQILNSERDAKRKNGVAKMINNNWSVAATLKGLLKTNVVLPAVIGRGEDEKDYFYPYPGSTDLVAVDNEGFGQVKIHIPYKGIKSKNWSTRNSLSDLYHYHDGEGQEVNLIKKLFLYEQNSAQYKDGVSESVIDLMIIPRWKIKTHPLCSAGSGSGQAKAFSLMRSNLNQKRSRVDMETLHSLVIYCVDSKLAYYDVDPRPYSKRNDPKEYYSQSSPDDVLGYQKHMGERTSSKGRSLDEWMQISKDSQYPDAIRSFLRDIYSRPYNKNSASKDQQWVADLIFSLKEGWNARSNKVSSTDHGYAHFGSMNVPMMFYSPKKDMGGKELKQGVRATDLTPTVLRLLGIKWDTNTSLGKWFDGEPLHPSKANK